MGTARVAPPTDVSAEPRRRLASFIDFEATDSKDLGYLIELSAKAAQAANLALRGLASPNYPHLIEAWQLSTWSRQLINMPGPPKISTTTRSGVPRRRGPRE